MIRNALIAALAVVSIGTVSIPASAQSGAVIRIAPPAARYEAVPQPRRGYVWTPGYWDWRRGQYTWVGGNWVRERRGYVYQQPAWVQHDGRWELRRGAWGRGDRDRDGIPNRADRHPNDPRRP